MRVIRDRTCGADVNMGVLFDTNPKKEFQGEYIVQPLDNNWFRLQRRIPEP